MFGIFGSFGIFRPKIERIDNYKTFLYFIKKLRKLKVKTPITDEFEGRNKPGFVNTAWYSYQGEHWEGWLNGYAGTGFYNRKNNQRTAKFIYNHIMCPPMFIWLAETIGIDKNLISKAVESANTTKEYQRRCGIIRQFLPWEVIEEAILKIKL